MKLKAALVLYYSTNRCAVTVTVAALSPETQMCSCEDLSLIGIGFSLGYENHPREQFKYRVIRVQLGLGLGCTETLLTP